MPKFSLQNIDYIGGKQKYQKLIVDSTCLFDDFVAEYEDHPQYCAELARIFRIMEEVANGNRVPNTKFHPLKNTAYGEFEFKSSSLRLYGIFLKGSGRIIILGGLKTSQDKDIRRLQSLAKTIFRAINMNREKLLKTPEYWLAGIQNDLYNEVENHLTENKVSRTAFAARLGVTKGYVSQVLNGDFDFKLSKFIKLCLAIGKVPQVTFKNLEDVITQESENTAYNYQADEFTYSDSIESSYLSHIHANANHEQLVGVVVEMVGSSEIRKVSSFHAPKRKAVSKG